MTTATAHFTSIGTVAAALQAQLKLAQLPANGGAAFQRVELFDIENIEVALHTLLISEQRIAVVVPRAADWTPDSAQRKLVVKRMLPVSILISDRKIGNRTTALFGDATTPGAYGLAALALPLITGQLIHNPNGIISRPVNETILTLKSQERQDMPGRAVLCLDIECQGGWMEAALDAGPTL